MKRTAIDAYLANVPQPARRSLASLCKVIRASVPKTTEEAISYQVAAFKYLGMLVGFGATKHHCAFFVMSGTVLDDFDVSAYDTSKGTIRFPHGTTLPATLVRRIVKARIAENKARELGRKKQTRPRS